MSVAQHAGRGRHEIFTTRQPLYTKWWLWTIVVLLLTVLASGAWVGEKALHAKDQLTAAQAEIAPLKAAAVNQDSKETSSILASVSKHANAAVTDTKDPLWRAWEIVPYVGPNLTAVRQLAGITDGVLRTGVGPLLQVESGTLNPAALKPKGGAINVTALQSAVAPVQKANAALHTSQRQLNAIKTTGTLPQIKTAKSKLLRLLATVTPLTKQLATILPLLPPALGAKTPQNYLVIFLNNAEARSLGGTALSTALITVDKGTIKLTKTVTAVEFGYYPTTPVITAPAGVNALYPNVFAKSLPDSTVRPDFVTTAQIVEKLWLQHYGQAVDGVISVDPVALSYILRATPPIALASGDVLDSQTVVPLLLNTVYQRYWTKNIATDAANQTAVYSSAVQSTFAALSGGSLDPKILVTSLMQATAERRLLLWSPHPDDQRQIVKYKLSGPLPQSTAKIARAGVYLQDFIGSKLSFYVTQSITQSVGVCRADGRANYRITIALTNTAPPNAKVVLSPSILGLSTGSKTAGTQRMMVYLYAPPGSQILRATANGAPTALSNNNDTDYPVDTLHATFAPQTTETITFDILAPKANQKKLEVQTTPLATAGTIATAPLDCSTVSP